MDQHPLRRPKRPHAGAARRPAQHQDQKRRVAEQVQRNIFAIGRVDVWKEKTDCLGAEQKRKLAQVLSNPLHAELPLEFVVGDLVGRGVNSVAAGEASRGNPGADCWR